MGYLKEFREDITTRLEALDTKSRDDVRAFVNVISNVVLDSYRNGQKSPKKESPKKGQEKGKGEKSPA